MLKWIKTIGLISLTISPLMVFSSNINLIDKIEPKIRIKNNAKIGSNKIWYMNKDIMGKPLTDPYFGVVISKNIKNNSSPLITDKSILSQFCGASSIDWGSNGALDLNKTGIYKGLIVAGKNYEKIKIFVVDKIIKNKMFNNKTLPSNFSIPNSVTTIEKAAFQGSILNDNFKIPKSVINIKEAAFQKSTLNDNFKIPKSVTNIGAFAFSLIGKLPKGFELPYIKTINNNTFWGTKLNENFKIPNSVTNIGAGAFQASILNQAFKIPSSLKTIGAFAFSQIKRLPIKFKLPNIKIINNNTFWQTKLNRNFKIPSSVITIGNSAFKESTLNDNFKIPNSVTNIGDFAFQKSILNNNFQIPSSVTFIGEYAFSLIGKLPKGFKLPNLEIINRATFWKTWLNDDFKIPSSVKTIGSSAFEKTTLNEHFQIPSTVTTIENDAFLSASLDDDVVINSNDINELNEFFNSKKNYSNKIKWIIVSTSIIALFFLSGILFIIIYKYIRKKY